MDPAFAVRDPNAFDGGAIVVYLLGDIFKMELKIAHISILIGDVKTVWPRKARLTWKRFFVQQEKNLIPQT